MSYSFEESSSEKKFKGVRRRKWGKWVSEIRVPGTQERLWLGSYSTPEAAAVAHDVAYYCLRRPISLQSLNFPLNVPAGVSPDMSPRSIQQAASDAGMAVDAQFISGNRTRESFMKTEEEEEEEGRDLHGRFEEEFMEGVGEASAACEDEEALSISDYL